MTERETCDIRYYDIGQFRITVPTTKAKNLPFSDGDELYLTVGIENGHLIITYQQEQTQEEIPQMKTTYRRYNINSSGEVLLPGTIGRLVHAWDDAEIVWTIENNKLKAQFVEELPEVNVEHILGGKSAYIDPLTITLDDVKYAREYFNTEQLISLNLQTNVTYALQLYHFNSIPILKVVPKTNPSEREITKEISATGKGQADGVLNIPITFIRAFPSFSKYNLLWTSYDGTLYTTPFQNGFSTV